MLALPATGAILLAARWRGRSARIDALHALGWLHPLQLPLLVGGHALAALLASACFSAVLLGQSVGWKRAWSGCRELVRLARARHVPWLVALCAVVWLNRLTIPVHTSGGELDGSWVQTLCDAWNRGLLEGTDWIFTAGPLGLFHIQPYDHRTFWTATIVWECGVKVVIAVVLTLAMLRISGTFSRATYIALALLLPVDPDSWAYLAVLGATAMILDRPDPRRSLTLVLMALICVLALCKFTLLTLSATSALLTIFTSWRSGGMRRGLEMSGAWAALQLAAWLLAGQSLFNIVPFLSRSRDLASGYSEAMSWPPLPSLALAAAFSGAGALVVALCHALARPLKASHVAASLALLAATVMVFKAGYTRGDDYHPRIFFGFIGAAPFLIGDPPVTRALVRTVSWIGRATCLAAAITGLWLAVNFDIWGAAHLVDDAMNRSTWNLVALLDLPARQRANDGERHQRRVENHLPLVRAAVGTDTIDMVSFEQGLLLLNGLHWDPRISVQGYCAYTPALLQANAEHFESEEAPEFVLFRLETIDERLPTMDDNRVLEILLRDYRPVLTEHGLLLLKKQRAGSRASARETILDRTIRMGETVELPAVDDACRLLALDVRYTWRGWLWKSVYAAPPLRLRVSTSPGVTRAFRIVPGMMTTGVILDPLLVTMEDWLKWGHGEPLDHVTAISVETDSTWVYAPDISMRLVRAPDLHPHLGEGMTLALPDGGEVSVPVETVSRANGAITPEPLSIESDLPLRAIAGSEGPMLVLHAPARATLALSVGQHRIRGQMGLAPAARRKGCETKVEVTASVVSGESRTVLFEHVLDSRSDEESVGFRFDIPFETKSPASLWLSSTDLGSRDECAWTCWRQVILE